VESTTTDYSRGTITDKEMRQGRITIDSNDNLSVGSNYLVAPDTSYNTLHSNKNYILKEEIYKNPISIPKVCRL